MYDRRFTGPGGECSTDIVEKSILVRLLPYVEQSTLYDKIDQRWSIYATENAALHREQVPLFSCPSDTWASVPSPVKPGQYAPMAPDLPGGPWMASRASYAFSFRTYPHLAMRFRFANCEISQSILNQLNGAFSDKSRVSLADVTDGLSQTIFASERTLAAVAPLEEALPGISSEYGVWVGGDMADTLFTTFCPPNAYRKVSVGAKIARIMAAASMHPGGVHMLMGDGSVHWVRDDIHTWPFE
jgi:prepilin-type processing-associated H-X9-DG protein